MPNAKKWDIWIGVIWIFAAGSAVYSTFLIMRRGIIEEIIGIDNVSITYTSYDYFVIFGLLILTLGLFLLAVVCSMINDDLKNAIDYHHHVIADGDGLPSRTESSHQLGDDEFSDDRKALKILRMSRGSPLRGAVSEKAIIYHINDIPVSTASEANAALVEGNNTVQWKSPRGAVKTSKIIVNDRDLKAQFEQLLRS